MLSMVIRRKLVVVVHQADEVGVHKVVEDHDEHAGDQGHAQFDDSLCRFLAFQYINSLVFTLLAHFLSSGVSAYPA